MKRIATRAGQAFLLSCLGLYALCIFLLLLLCVVGLLRELV